MNVSIISTYKEKKPSNGGSKSSQLSSRLVKAAEADLLCPENRDLISLEGLEKVRSKLA